MRFIIRVEFEIEDSALPPNPDPAVITDNVLVNLNAWFSQQNGVNVKKVECDCDSDQRIFAVE